MASESHRRGSYGFGEYPVSEGLLEGILESVQSHQRISAERPRREPYSNYGSRTVKDSYDRFGLDPEEARDVLALLRQDGCIRYSREVLPGLEMTTVGTAWLRILSGELTRSDLRACVRTDAEMTGPDSIRFSRQGEGARIELLFGDERRIVEEMEREGAIATPLKDILVHVSVADVPEKFEVEDGRAMFTVEVPLSPVRRGVRRQDYETIAVRLRRQRPRSRTFAIDTVTAA